MKFFIPIQYDDKSPISLMEGIHNVALFIDWDNLFYGLFNRFGMDEMNIEERLKRLLEWIKTDMGQLMDGYGFVFAPEHLTIVSQQLCIANKLRLITCPKRKLKKPKLNPKTGKMMSEEDTVDETIIWFAKWIANHSDVDILCLVTGDSDYIPMIKEIKEKDIKIAVAPPSSRSLSSSGDLINLVDINPTTLKKMLFMLDYPI